MRHEFEVHSRGETIVRLANRWATERFFGLFEIDIPAVVFETLRPGVPFVIQVKAHGRYHPLTLFRVVPIHLAYQPLGPLPRPPGVRTH